MLRFIPLMIALLSLHTLAAQQPDPSGIYMFKMTEGEGKRPGLTNPVYLTDFNPDGYNNQPCFVSSNVLLISAGMPSDTFQTDIYALDLRDNTITRVTATAESEYSPTVMPDYFYFSAVRVEADPGRTQRLWEFPMDRLNNGKPLFPSIRNVGYHYWMNRFEVLLYITDTPNQLVVADTRDQSWKRVSTDVGRCFKRLPNGRVAFVQKESDDLWMLCELNPADYTASGIIPTLPGVEDFAIRPDGTFLMGRGSKLYHFDPQRRAEGWKEIADLRSFGITAISRLVTNGKESLVLVGQ